MNEVREIVTKAIVAKGKKYISLSHNITSNKNPYSILGCWVINHDFNATENNKCVKLNGTFEINIWYSLDNNTRTEIARATTTYEGNIKVKDVVCDETTGHTDVIVRILQHPTCTSACINDGNVEIEVVFDALAEIIGEAKMMVNVYNCPDTIDAIDNFENEINEDFINEN